jgi:hypothetical protein
MAPISVTLGFRLPTGRCFNKPTFCLELFFLTTDKPRSLGDRTKLKFLFALTPSMMIPVVVVPEGGR